MRRRLQVETADFSVEHRLGVRGAHDFGWGAEYRRIDAHSSGSLSFSLRPEDHGADRFAAFAQDEIALFDRNVHVTVGGKVERSEFTGWSLQPTARMHWAFAPSSSVWGAVSRAAHTPSQVDRGALIHVAAIPRAVGLPMVLAVVGDPEYGNEWLTAYEGGYRIILGASLTVDLAAYYNQYSGGQTVEPRAPVLQPNGGVPYLMVPLQFANLLDATTAGVETSIAYTPAQWLQLGGSYSVFTIDPNPKATSADASASTYDGSVPRHQGQLRSSVAVGRSVSVDSTLFLVGRLREVDVPSYTRLDARIAWDIRAGVELALVGQNLFDVRHVEFTSASAAAASTRLSRSIYTKVSWRF